MNKKTWNRIPPSIRTAIQALLESVNISIGDLFQSEPDTQLSKQHMLSTKEAAAIIGVSRFTISRLIKAGKIKAKKIGTARSAMVKIFPDSVDNFLRSKEYE